MAILTTEKLMAADCFLSDESLVFRLLPSKLRHKLINATYIAFDAELTLSPTTKPSLNLIRARVKDELEKQLVGFIPAILITVFLQWMIMRLLDWLWDNK